MKILLTSATFYPELGGLHPIAYLAAKDWMSRGHEVRLLTNTPGRFWAEEEINVIRQPGFRKMLELYRWSDVVFQNHASVRYWWPILIVPRPYVVLMEGWANHRAANHPWKISFKTKLKLLIVTWILRRATRNIAASAAVAAGNRVPARIIPNAFDASQFRSLNPSMTNRSDALLFVGRLHADKGVDDLIRAVAILRRRGVDCRTVIAGDGPARAWLDQVRKDEDVIDRVTFVGPKVGEELASLMSSHRIVVIPSKWNEPFGIVALEAIACGCVVIGTEGGGLPGAIGCCGLTYPNGDVEALANRIEYLLSKGDQLTEFRECSSRHLHRHQPALICGEYLAEIDKAYRGIHTTH